LAFTGKIIEPEGGKGGKHEQKRGEARRGTTTKVLAAKGKGGGSKSRARGATDREEKGTLSRRAGRWQCGSGNHRKRNEQRKKNREFRIRQLCPLCWPELKSSTEIAGTDQEGKKHRRRAGRIKRREKGTI